MEKIKRQRAILITGGAGYIGSHTVKMCAEAGLLPVILDNLSTGHIEFTRYGTFFAGETADAALLNQIFSSYNISAVFHFAGAISVSESLQNPSKYYRNNTADLLVLLDTMLKHGVTDIIFSSSCAVNGTPALLPVDEETPLHPETPYGRSKLFAEEILRDYGAACGLRTIILRYFNAAGADPSGELGEWHEPETHLIPLALDTAAGIRKSLQVFGTDHPTADGTCIRDYIHVNDLASAHLLALEQLKKTGKSSIYTLANGQGFSVMEVIKTVERITGHPVPVSFHPPRPGDAPALIGSSKKIMHELGWKPAFNNLEEIISTAAHWHSQLHQK